MEGPLARFGGAAVHDGDGLRRHRKYRRDTMVAPGTYAKNLMHVCDFSVAAEDIARYRRSPALNHAKVDNGAGASHDSALRAQSFT